MPPAPVATPAIDPATRGIAALLNAAGASGPEGADVSEALAFVIAGGAGFGAIAAPAGSPVRWFVSGRHAWHGDLPYVLEATTRAGLDIARFEHESPEVGGVILSQWVQAPDPCVLAWVDAASLPWHGRPAAEVGLWPRVVLVRGFDAGGLLVDDLSGQLRAMSPEAFHAAQAALPQHRSRLIRLTDDAWRTHAAWQEALPQAITAGIAAGVGHLRTGHGHVAGLPALRWWAGALIDLAPFRARFVSPPDVLLALLDLHRVIRGQVGLMRGLFADGLGEASALLRDEQLRDLRDDHADLARRWSALADRCLPHDAQLDALQRLAVEVDRGVTRHVDPATQAERRARLAEQRGELCLSWHPDPVALDAHLVSLGQGLLALAGREEEAAAELHGWLSGRG